MELKLNKLLLLVLLFYSFDISAVTCGLVFPDMYNTNSDLKVLTLYLVNSLEHEEDNNINYILIRNDNNLSNTIKSSMYDLLIYFTVYENVIQISLEKQKDKDKIIKKLFVNPDIIRNKNINSTTADLIKQINSIVLDLFDDISGVQSVEGINSIISNKKNIFKFEFPNAQLGVTGVSYKVFNDERSNLFSVFPVNLFVTFFPHDNFEIGLFYRFSYNSNIVLFRDIINKKTNEKLILFDMEYGFMTGFSTTYEKTVYSIGASFFNKQIFFSEKNKYTLVNDYRKYFMPQFSIYQKINIRLSKFIYYSIFINIKTSQMYEVANNYFYGKMFNYNLVVLELSFVGISVIF